jgi:hypothetical protein
MKMRVGMEEELEAVTYSNKETCVDKRRPKRIKPKILIKLYLIVN